MFVWVGEGGCVYIGGGYVCMFVCGLGGGVSMWRGRVCGRACVCHLWNKRSMQEDVLNLRFSMPLYCDFV